MTGFLDKNEVLHADDVSLHDIAAKAGTPSYIYSASKITDTVTRLKQAFAETVPADRQPLITFACKANSNVAVLRLMGSLGLGTDIVSGGEMARALAAGIDPQKIVFSGVGKTDEEITDALNSGILQINVESRPELERIAYIAEKMGKVAPVVFRINPDVDAGTHAKITTGKAENKFGIPRNEILPLYEWATKNPHLKPRGFSQHIGSQLTNLAPFRAAFTKLAALVEQVRAKGMEIESLDLGGGLGVIYKDETPPDLKQYAEIIHEILYPLNTQIILEPGRLLVAEAGVLLSRVIYVKEGENKRYLILDAGMNDLMRPALYEAWHTVRPVNSPGDAALATYDIVGPVCETGDTFAKGRDLPDNLQAGDLVALMTGGAYGFVMASNYNTRALPAEVMVHGTKTAIIRPRDTIQAILDKDVIPDWLD